MNSLVAQPALRSAPGRTPTLDRAFNFAPEIYDVYKNSVSDEHLFDLTENADLVTKPCLVCEPVEDLIEMELRATRDLHASISEESYCNTVATWCTTTFAKRVLYLSFPVIL